VSLYLLLSGRCRNSGRTAAYKAIRYQRRYISGGERETEYDRHNPSFGCHYLTYFHIPKILESYISILSLIYPFLTARDYCFDDKEFHNIND